ncbi:MULTISPECIES: hypothetical protein [Caproicibacterium]|uniref:Uncharacterized protein n=1 Tax=Caproicibacterium argilliputei TaxID=3030016 RepID=A0AA97DB30_9FIRM|nr:hypothetical protein [Caproicibacterium argilliputei]WOC32348.1 hypothetical protein PXC00_00340 [Caproicibacterium argilliputei]
MAKDECCIVFDLGCYFPYRNSDVLTFNFTLGMEEFDDYKINHRYPNKSYQTISRKYGRKVSKMGYPYIMKLNEQLPMLLCIKVGINDKYVALVFPVQTSMTASKPICALSLRYMFDKNEFYFKSHEKAEGGGYYQHIWKNYELEKEVNNDNEILLNNPCKIDNSSNTLIYDDIIKPCSSLLQDILL